MPVFSARGKPKYETYLQACNLIILIILVYPLTKFYGIYGTSIALFTAHLTLTCLSLYTVAKLIDCRRITLVKVLIFPLGNAILMGIIIFVLKNWTADYAGPVQFIFLITAALFSYGTIIILMDKIMGYGMIPLLKEKWNMIVRIKI
jgi:O-antigen/teichoic acid export membrane protein